ALLDACPSSSWKALIALCRWAGLRRSEAVRMDWPQVDFAARTLTVAHQGEQTTKKRTRVAPMDPRLYAVLMDRFNAAGDGERVFADDPHNLTKDVKAIIKRAGLEPWDKSFHTLRENCER